MKTSHYAACAAAAALGLLLIALGALGATSTSTATSTQAVACQSPSTGHLEEALDYAAYTVELRVAPSTNALIDRIDARFDLPEWDAAWTCYTWEVELVLPVCWTAHNHRHTAVDDSVNPVTGLTSEFAAWTLYPDEALTDEGERSTPDEVCATLDRSTIHRYASTAHYKVGVRSANNQARVTLPNGKTHRAYPLSLTVGR